MMKLIVAFILATSTILTGCATKNADGTVTQPDFGAIIAQVQSYCKVACGFVPTAGTILSLVTGANPGVIAATAVSQAICNAMNPPAALKRGTPMIVKG